MDVNKLKQLARPVLALDLAHGISGFRPNNGALFGGGARRARASLGAALAVCAAAPRTARAARLRDGDISNARVSISANRHVKLL